MASGRSVPCNNILPGMRYQSVTEVPERCGAGQEGGPDLCGGLRAWGEAGTCSWMENTRDIDHFHPNQRKVSDYCQRGGATETASARFRSARHAARAPAASRNIAPRRPDRNICGVACESANRH